MELDLDKFTDDDLIALNRLIVQTLNSRRQLRTNKQLMKFTPGQEVKFRGDDGEWIFGAVVRVNKKSVTVHTCKPHHAHWRISPQLLSDAGHQAQHDSDNSVIQLFQ